MKKRVFWRMSDSDRNAMVVCRTWLEWLATLDGAFRRAAVSEPKISQSVVQVPVRVRLLETYHRPTRVTAVTTISPR